MGWGRADEEPQNEVACAPCRRALSGKRPADDGKVIRGCDGSASFVPGSAVPLAVGPSAFWRGSRTIGRGRAGLLPILALVFAAIVPAPAIADCDRSGITVVGNLDERDDACAALGEVLHYFADAGLAVELRLTIRFEQFVHLERGADAPAPLADADPIAVSGFYHAARREIRMTSSTSPWIHQRKPWNLPWDRPLSHSILTHEVAHAIIYQLLGVNHRKLPRAWHEALAYAVQIELMAPDLRAKILGQYPDQQAFSSTLYINDVVYGLDPDGFAIAAYRTYVRNGGIDFLKRAIALQLEMIDLNDLP